MTLIKVLQNELRSLSEEARRKHPAIKDAADRGIRQLRSIQEKVDDDNVNQAQALRSNEEIIKPFLLACESKTPKMIAISMTSLQQLLLHSAVPIGGVNIIVETVARLCDQSVEEAIYLKILQLSLTVFASSEYELNQTSLAKLLRVSFQLHSSKLLNVHYTATATIRQAITVLFDKLAVKTKETIGEQETISITQRSEDDSDEVSMDLFSYAKNMYLLLRDLCLFVEGQPGIWLNVSGVSPPFVLELVETVITGHASLLAQYPQLVQIVEEKLCPLVEKYINTATPSSGEYAFVIRSYRIASSIIQYFYNLLKPQCQAFLQRVCVVINTDSPLWNRVLAFEVFKAVCHNQEILRLLYEELDHNTSQNDTNILIDLIGAVSACVQKLSRETQTPTLLIQQYMKKENRLDIMLERDVTQTTVEECLALCLECIITIVSSMSILAGVHKSNNAATSQEEMSEQETKELERTRDLCGRMVEHVWCPILAALSQLLDRCDEDDVVQHILRTYLLFTHTCGVTGLATPRDAFLTSLCKFTPQVTGTTLLSPITRKNVQVIKILFNFAHCLGGLLGSSWYLLLKNFQMFESIMTRDNFKGELDEDLKILDAALNHLFKSTEDLDSEALEIVLKALCSLSKDTLKNSSDSPRLFGASKLVETVQINAKRVNFIWSYFSAHILFLVEHQDESVRKFGVDSVASVILAIIRPEYNTFTDEQTVVDSGLEQNIFSIFALIFASKYKDVKERALHAINNLIHKCGQVMSGSWPIILPILTACCEEADPNSDKPSLDPKYIPIAFKGVQTIGNEFLQSLSNDFLLQYLETVGMFARQNRAADVNISLVSVGLFMGIADYLAAENNLTDLWIKLFFQFVNTITDIRPEVRHASLRTLTFIMTSCGEKFGEDCWNACIGQVLPQVLELIEEEASRAETAPESPIMDPVETKKKKLVVHHSRNTAAKQWSETRSLAIESISRIIKEHGSKEALKGVTSFEALCSKFTEFIYQSIQTKTNEIFKSSTRFLQEMLLTTEEPALPILWAGAWKCWSFYADCAANGDPVESNNVTFLVEGWIELYKARKNIFSQEDIKLLIQLNHMFMMSPVAADVVVHPSTIQKTCLLLIREIVSFSDETYTLVFDDLSSVLPTRKLIQQQLEMQEKERSVKNPANLPPPTALQPAVKLAIAVQKDLVDLCCLNAPEVVQKRLFHRLVNVLGTMMLTKYVIFTRKDPKSKAMARGNPPFFYPLWKHTIRLFDSVVSSSLKHFDIEDNSQTVDEMWVDFCLAIETFLFPSEHELGDFVDDNKSDDDSDSEESDDEMGRENSEIQLVNQIEKHALPHCISASGQIKKRIIAILERATHSSPKPVATESLKCLFRLVKESSLACEKNQTQNSIDSDAQSLDHMIEIGQFLVPMIIHRCGEILKNFAKEDQRTGMMPLPRYRKEEVLNVLTELRSVEVNPLLFAKCSANSDSIPSLCGSKGLIIRLFPVLCEFVAVSDTTVKGLLLDMFRIVSQELGLTKVAELEQTTIQF